MMEKDKKRQLKYYELYRLRWLIAHKLNLTDLVKELGKCVNKQLKETNSEAIDMEQIFETWIQNGGFDGEIWKSFHEFLETEL